MHTRGCVCDAGGTCVCIHTRGGETVDNGKCVHVHVRVSIPILSGDTRVSVHRHVYVYIACTAHTG